MKKILLMTLMMVSTQIFAKGMMAHDAYVRLLPPSAKTTGAFMMLMNHTDKDKKLIKATSDVANKVEVHNHVMVDGMMQMREVPFIAIKANQSIELKPGSYHIMLIDLKQPLQEGQIVEMTLVMDDGEKVVVKAPVKKMNEHKHHHHH